MRIRLYCATTAAVSAMAISSGACGGDDPKDHAPAKRGIGGTLTALWAGDVDTLDPGATFTLGGLPLALTTQRPLLNFRPDDGTRPVPDLAQALPRVTDGGRTVTVQIRKGVRFSPPVDREVTAKDVRYAIERGFFRTVNAGFANSSFGDVIGTEPGAEPGTRVAGIETPDDRTVIFRLERPSGGYLASALSLPLTAPVPREYALPFDRRSPSRYAFHHVATGPYMVRSDADGKIVGYEPGRSIELVRNPNWDRRTDYKPAYLDEVRIEQGHSDPVLATRRVLNGKSMIAGDFGAPPPILRELLPEKDPRLEPVSPGNVNYLSLNTKLPPFDDLDVRRAVLAGFDREAVRAAEGGPSRGPLATHFLPPGVPGFEEAGGLEGPGYDFLSHPQGDPELAAHYFRRAGFASGRYEGGGTLKMIGLSIGALKSSAAVAAEQLEKLGFDVELRTFPPDVALPKFCRVPRQRIHVCQVGWTKSFPDPQVMLHPTFNGNSILATGNVNYPQLDVRAINDAMERAVTVVGLQERAKAWAEIDRMVTAQAPAIPVVWATSTLVRSSDVAGVANEALARWDLAFTSVK